MADAAGADTTSVDISTESLANIGPRECCESVGLESIQERSVLVVERGAKSVSNNLNQSYRVFDLIDLSSPTQPPQPEN